MDALASRWFLRTSRDFRRALDSEVGAEVEKEAEEDEAMGEATTIFFPDEASQFHCFLRQS